MLTLRHDGGGGFVGRADSLFLMDLWLQDALRREPRLVLIVGDAGVGKSRFVEEWLRRNDDVGLRVLAGSAYEDVATPFLPIASALAAVPGAEPLFTPGHGREVSELDVFLGVSRVVLEAARHRPTVLVLNDLHWADRATLDLLAHIVACAARPGTADRPRLLVVVIGRRHGPGDRWQQALKRLPLESMCRVLELGGLDEAEVNELLAVRTGLPPAKQFVRSVVESTDGNPLVVGLLLDRLEAESSLVVRNGRLGATVPIETRVVAADLEDAWVARLDKMGPSGRDALVLAALLGDGGRLADLQSVTGFEAAELHELVEHGRANGLMFDDGRNYRFYHPYVRRALVASLSSVRREALEAVIAERLLESPTGADDVLTIVQHLRRAGPAAVTHQLPELARVAAEQASAKSAWGLAAVCYEDALAGLTDSSSMHDRALLHLRAGQAHHRNHDFDAALPHHLAAIELSKQLGDLELWGEALFWLGGVGALQRSDGGQFDEGAIREFLERAGDDLRDERALVLAYVAEHHFGRLEPAAGLPAIAAADELSRTARRPATRHFVSHIHATVALGCLDLATADDCFAEALALNDQHDDPWQAVWVEVGAPLVGLVAGRLEQADAQAARAIGLSSECQQWDLHGLGTALRAAIAVAEGRARDGQRHASQAILSYERSGFFYAGAVAFPHLAAACSFLGDVAGARQALRRWQDQVGEYAVGHALLIELYSGEPDGVRDLAERFHPFGAGVTPTLFTLHTALVAVEVGDRLGRADWVEAGYDHLRRAHQLGVAYTLEWATAVLPVLAQAAISLSQFDVALHLLDASEEQLLSPLARARANVCRARLNLAAGNTSGATASLRAALDYFEPANLLALCREVHRLAPEGSLALRRDLVILYTDIVGSTGLNVALGDQLFLEMLRAHNETVRRRLDRFGGVEFTYTGDGVGARFRSVDAALGFAVGLQTEFDEQNQTREGLPLQVRIGLALGDALEDAGNLFGQTVVRAVRICSFADAGQVFVGAEVAAMADPVAFQLRPAGSVSLKGFGGSHELFDVQPTRAMVASSPGQPM